MLMTRPVEAKKNIEKKIEERKIEERKIEERKKKKNIGEELFCIF